MSDPTPLNTLIDALAQRAVDDYLTAQSALQAAESAQRSDHVPLQSSDLAA